MKQRPSILQWQETEHQTAIVEIHRQRRGSARNPSIPCRGPLERGVEAERRGNNAVSVHART
jgi:hypothetical protein